MNRALIEKTYPGEMPRPTVEVVQWENNNFIMAATPWGNKDTLKEISDSYTEFLTATMADREATSPFARIPTLSPLANSLRAASIYANEKACKKCNGDSYDSSCEALVLTFENNEMAWIQVGQPHLLLLRGTQVIPLEVGIDLGLDFQMKTPLPSRLMGIDRQFDLAVKSILLEPEDRLLLLARSTIPKEFFNLDLAKTSQDLLDSFFDLAVTADNKVPFWISILG